MTPVPGNHLSWSARFSEAARTIADAARAMGLEVPGFRSPPASAGATRTLRRFADGRCVVAVRAAGRPHVDVVHDLADGVVAANRLVGGRAEAARRSLIAAATGPVRRSSGHAA